MIRTGDWEHRLDRFLLDNSARPFRYGSWDCCLFVCDAIEAMTGIDVANKFRGQYANPKQARALARELCGGASVWDIARSTTGRFELKECIPAMARRGDVVLIPRKADYSLGLIDLTGQVAYLTRWKGIARAQFTVAQIGWHV